MEEEGIGGHGGAGAAAVAAGYDLGDGFGRHFSASHINQCADNGADHISQKAIGCDYKTPHIAVGRTLLPFGSRDGADVGFYLCMKF